MEDELPPPELLLREAEQERNPRVVERYVDVIRTLRGKDFSYREIAQWLSGHGVEVDHNEVYRAYTKHMEPEELARVQEDDIEEAIQEQEEERS